MVFGNAIHHKDLYKSMKQHDQEKKNNMYKFDDLLSKSTEKLKIKSIHEYYEKSNIKLKKVVKVDEY